MKKSFNTQITAAHPIVNNHAVYGQRILPGLGYIDMVYQLGHAALGLDPVQHTLNRISIHNPLVVGEQGHVALRIGFEPMNRGWKITVEGTEVGSHGATPQDKLYMTAELLEEARELPLRVSVEEWKRSAGQRVDLEAIYSNARNRGLVHQGLMKASGAVYRSGQSYLIETQMDGAYRELSQSMLYHPTLIDSAAVAMGFQDESLEGADPQDLFIPLYFESFYAKAPMRSDGYAYVDQATFRRVNDILTVDIAYLDAQGNQVALLKGVTSKRVRFKEQINSAATAAAPRPAATPAPTPTPAPAHASVGAHAGSASPQELESNVRVVFGRYLQLEPSGIDVNTGFYELGLESSQLLSLVRDLEAVSGASLQPTLLFEYTTISELCTYMATVVPQGQAQPLYSAEQEVAAAAELPSLVSYEAPQAPEAVLRPEAEDIAVIGMAGRFPDADNLQEFWANLVAGKDCIQEIPASRWDWKQYENVTSPTGKKVSKWGGFINNPDYFDPQFFRISPREAEVMDPQERLFLETCWEAMEDAGYTPKTLVPPRGPNQRKPVGVFVGAMHKDYAMIGSEAFAQGQLFALSLQNAPIANRVSYFCNFHGPSMAIDTLCSSSLTALHLALESLHSGESEVAIAGGVNLCLHPHKYLSYGMLDFFSSDGYCHTFGKGGDGYVPGEGVGAVILKPLSKAQRDGDSIYAVIKGSTVNHGGTVSGITVPSPVAQADLIQACFEKTNIDPRTISYVEAHGTGTSLGDPIEIDGLVKSYRPYTQDVQYCAIGSVKSNIGHAESAAGISGLMKTILQLHHKTLVPSLHSEEINPLIDFARTPFYVQHQTEYWKQPEIVQQGAVVQVPRRAAISSFGATGSNANVILEEYIPEAKSNHRGVGADNQPTIVPLSAKSAEQLSESAQRLLQYLKQATGQASPVVQQVEDSAHRVELEGKLRALVSEVINVEEDDVEIHQEWSEFGIDLVQLTQIRDRLQEEYKGQIELDLHAGNSIASVVESILPAHRGEGQMLASSAVEWKQGEIHLQDLAYTLQVGREAMEERLVFIVKNIPDLVEKLEKYLQNPAEYKDCYRGHEKRNKDFVDVLSKDEDSMDLIRKWIHKGKLSSLADLWVKGYQMDWNLLYGQGKPRRMHLPTYPFMKERYWIEVEAKPAFAAGQQATALLHPLLHQNTSDLSEQRFSSVFTGKEFFLTDHVVNGQRILPGVAHLEMARAAAELAAGGLTGVAWKLDNVVWIRPLVVEGSATEVHIRLQPEAHGEISYEIYTGSDEQEVVYSQGRAIATAGGALPRLDLAQRQAECSQGSLTAEQCYQTFSKMGMEYGAGHRGIQVVYTGADQALAKLSLPYSIHSTKDAYTLNPGLLDSALQATIGVTLGADISALESLKPTLPFALQEIVTYAPVPAESWVALRFSPGVKRGDSVLKYDLDLCNEQGEICVSIKGFTMRVLDGGVKTASVPKTGTQSGNPLVGALTLYPIWNGVLEAKGPQLPSVQDQVVVIGGSEANISAIRQIYPQAHHLAFSASDEIHDMVSKFQTLPAIDHLIWIAPAHTSTAPSDDAMIEGQATGFYQLFRVIKAMLQLGYGKKKLGWSVWTASTQKVLATDVVNAEHAGIYGLTGSMAKEYTNWSIRVVDVAAGDELPLHELFTLPVDRQGRAWAYRNQQWFQQQLIPYQSPALKQSAYRHGGVYVVIGGAGSVGEMWSEYMIRTYNARIIWIGRRQKDATIQAQLDRLATFGTAPRYISADAGNFESLNKAYEEIKTVDPQIHGIVHSTMVLLDQGLEQMQEQEMRNVLVSKVDVSVRMAQVFGREALDFVLFFSSLMAFTKAAKQSSYAAGCTFEDVFAHQVAQVWPCKVRVINWGYWGKGDGGVTDSESHQALAETYSRLAAIGIGLIEPAEAWERVENLLAGPAEQLGFMKTTKQIPIEGVNPELQAVVDAHGQIIRLANAPTVASTPAPKLESAPKPARGNATGQLKEKTTTYLKKLVGDTLKMSVNKIDAAEPLEMYGIDSIIIVELTNSLRDDLGEIPSTLFFECQTIDELAEYFMKSQKDSLTAMFGTGDSSTAEVADAGSTPQAVLQTPAKRSSTSKKSRRFADVHERGGSGAAAKTSAIQDVAVIGLSGRYPQAKNLHEFWEKLASGTNCITEIPADRWDWKKYFHPERGREGSIYTKWGGFLENIDQFDPLFFNITPREARIMDPQERLFLEVAYSSIEDAGYTPATLNDRKKVGVFVGVMNSNYPSGTAYWSIANRLSYLLNFRGPSMAIDTACSSSLTALHLALESIYSGTSECAIVGGVNLVVDPFHYIRLTSQNMLSPGNRCNTFGDQADGFVDSEAVGAVLLKPLHKAVEDGDHIYGVIKGSMINSGGKVNGYTVPNPNAQFQLISEALQRAGVHARTVSYVEAHGTGTALGDPIEIEGLRQAYELDTTDKQYCSIGSVKSNIGHSESAAGIAGLTKVLLQLKHRQLVPSLHSETLNPRIQFANTPFTVQQELVPWERPVVEIDGQTKEYPRIAGLSSFGAGGSNAHVIIEEYIPDPAHAAVAAARPLQVPIVLSAKTEDSLKEQAQRLLDAVRSNAYTDGDLASIAYTLQVGREAMEDRLGLLVGSLAELEEKLQGYLNQQEDLEHVYQGQVKRNKEALLYFTTDEDLMEAVDKWIDARKYTKLIDLWVKGLPLDWSKFYGSETPRRISLPTYAFAKGKYWLSPAEVAAISPQTATHNVRPLLPVASSSNSWDKEGTTKNCWNYVLWSGRV
ncbi:beta-ketoacyl synthase N-terminal-like domain-containing protein [Tumebacillus permanentifrigoris]|uniref:Phosphopantetheine binding protein n=1 Tax=Tumebacillus permanentifrigoris TaxID=378543 RepID=A0A316DB11_9BACL|nr:beta-ketoacyl synthase N-terminal-like domain-containing protein [Tumebacillus permanentifrigoris]PWK14992.1 phosphopantetheine binding protein [Tumebacillus permanentifrigoris]